MDPMILVAYETSFLDEECFTAVMTHGKSWMLYSIPGYSLCLWRTVVMAMARQNHAIWPKDIQINEQSSTKFHQRFNETLLNWHFRINQLWRSAR